MNTTVTKIDFIESHHPALQSGEYRVSVAQALNDTGSKITAQNYTATKTFFVAGDRFFINPQCVHSTFPANNALGDYADVLPHIMLKRSTLPWERSAISNDEYTPWLGLLLVHEDELADTSVSTVSLSELESVTTVAPYFPGLTLESGQQSDDKVQVLDITKSLLAKLLPDKDTLCYMTHIRQGKDSSGSIVGEDVVSLIANRLPQKGVLNTVYLVSLENRYNANGTFDYQSATDTDTIRLVHLHSWRFTVIERYKVTKKVVNTVTTFAAVKDKVNALAGTEFFSQAEFATALKDDAGLTDTEVTTYKEAIFAACVYGDFTTLAEHLDHDTQTLRLADLNNTAVDPYLQMGFYPLPHKLRQGAKTVSWYHSPLSPKSNDETITFPVKSADELLRYYQANGMFDVSYAAAWELGRLLALQDTAFSAALYQWKRRYVKALNKHSQLASDGVGHLRGGNRDTTPEPMPDDLKTWLHNLRTLQDVPFHYLVPAEQLLPTESIRFFQLDVLWIKSLLDGALSIGRVIDNDYALDQTLVASEITASTVSGFLLRSELVSGYPGMQIEGYDSTPATDADKSQPMTTTSMTVLVRKKVSENMLLCLFDGEIQTLDLHLKAEVLHFGLDPQTDGTYQKGLRDGSGVEQAAYAVEVDVNDDLVLNIPALVSSINAKYTTNNAIEWQSGATSANLALQLVDGVDSVRFIKQPDVTA